MKIVFLDAAPSLKLICESATGVNNINLAYAASKGIPVRNAVGYSTTSVVQSTFMHILSIAGAALDVFVKEPIPADNPLLHVRYPERLRLAPHAAWASVQARERLVAQIAENIAKGW